MKTKKLLALLLTVSVVLLAGCTRSVEWYKAHHDDAMVEFKKCFNTMTPDERNKDQNCQNAAQAVNGNYVLGIIPDDWKK